MADQTAPINHRTDHHVLQIDDNPSMSRVPSLLIVPFLYCTPRRLPVFLMCV